MKTVWAYAHVGSNPTLSAKKCSHRQVGTFFADKQDSNPKVRIKQESLTPALLYPCAESVLPGGVLNSSQRRAFGARYFVSQMTLRTVCVSPPASIPKQVLPNVPLFVPKPGSRYSDVGSGVSQFRKRSANAHDGYLNNRSGSALPINEILLYQCCSHHLTISSTHQQGGSPTPVEAIL